MGPTKTFPYVGQASETPPDFDRVVRALSDADLEDELLGGKGEPDYRLALVGEHDRRARAGSPS